MRTIKYSESSVGRDKQNPLVDLHPDDAQYYFQTLNSWVAAISTYAQVKDDFVWEQMHKRRPKQLHKGRAGPNSILSTVTGLLSNYINNLNQYGSCRLSKRQLTDVEFCSHFFAALDAEQFEMIQFQQALFDQAGNTF